MIACSFCGQRVDVTATGVFIKVEGWVQTRDGGGAHGVTFRRELGEYAHEACVKLHRMGISNDQGAMF